MKTFKKISLKHLLTHLFDIKNGKRQSVKIFNKTGTAYAILGSEGEDVFARIKREDEDLSFCSFDDCLFYMTKEKIFYKELI